MLTAFSLGAKIHNQMRLKNRSSYQLIILNYHNVTDKILPSSVYSLLSLWCLVSPHLFPPLPPSLFCLQSIALCSCHDESGRGSDRRGVVVRPLAQISVSFLSPSSKQMPGVGLKAMWGKDERERVHVPGF